MGTATAFLAHGALGADVTIGGHPHCFDHAEQWEVAATCPGLEKLAVMIVLLGVTARIN